MGTERTAHTLVDDEIEDMRAQIDELDGALIHLFRCRTEIARQVVDRRVAHGGVRLALARERQIVARYQQALGREGVDMAVLLLQAARGALDGEVHGCHPARTWGPSLLVNRVSQRTDTTEPH